MAWERMTVSVGDHDADGFFRAGRAPEATIPYHPDVALGAVVEVAGGRYGVEAQRRLRGEAKTGGGQNAIERKDPEKAAELIDGLTDPAAGFVQRSYADLGIERTLKYLCPDSR